MLSTLSANAANMYLNLYKGRRLGAETFEEKEPQTQRVELFNPFDCLDAFQSSRNRSKYTWA